MTAIEFDLHIDYPTDRVLNRVWLAMLVGGFAFGLPRAFIHYVFSTAIGRPYSFSADSPLNHLDTLNTFLTEPIVGGLICVVVVVAGTLFVWWRLLLWMIRNQMY